MKNFFFITGFPRSRTAWLANFFTFGKSFCWHDAMRGTLSVSGVADAFKKTATEYVGNSDSGLPFIAAAAKRLFPEARWLIVHRDRGTAQSSWEKFYGRKPNTPEVRVVFDRLEVGLKQLPQILAPGSFIECAFEDLQSKLVLEEAWRFLTPGNPWNPMRCELLDKMNVQQISAKM